MNAETFLAHHGLTENPFAAEEARHDPVFQRLSDGQTRHPDFDKILGRLDEPSTSIVFGEKGSGKTAIRLLIDKRLAQHNKEAGPGFRVLLVAYDDLNPVLDRVVHRRKHGVVTENTTEKVLAEFRLQDHQDAILSLAVTKLTDQLLGDDALASKLRKAPRGVRADALKLALIYDQPPGGTAINRFRQLRSKLRLGWRLPIAAMQFLRIATVVTALGLTAAFLLMAPGPPWLPFAVYGTWALAVGLWVVRGWRRIAMWWLGRRIRKDMLSVDRSPGELQAMLIEMRGSDLAHQPWPTATGGKDSRYELTRRFVDVLRAVGYAGLIMLVDRVDEPTLISGQTDRMRSVVWPMLDNKFLQQDGVGMKLLLPIELRHALHRESGSFFQEARLDKQNLIDRLTWSGATLYDLCNDRLQACRGSRGDRGEDQAEPINMTDLFEQDVTRETLIDALDQMHQPRDAFKFIYTAIQEHCRMVPQEQASYRIPKLTLDTVRRHQAQRVQELYQGLAPA